MSSMVLAGRGSFSDERRQHSRLRRSLIWLAGFLTVLVTMAAVVVLQTPAAQAATLGPGYGQLGSTGVIGAYVSESDGRFVYCMDLDAQPPFGTTTGPETVTTLDRYYGGSLSATDLAKLNYGLSKWGQSSDPDVTSAVAMFVWEITDPDTFAGRGGPAYFMPRIAADHRDAVLSNLAAIRDEANTNYVIDPSVNISVAMTDQYHGTLTVAASPATLQGTVTLSNATFPDGQASRVIGAGTYDIVGTPAAGVPDYQVGASLAVESAGMGARVDLYSTPGLQRVLGGGSPVPVSAEAVSPVIELDFQPEISTQVATKFVAEGDAFVDDLTVPVTKGTWISVEGSAVPLTAVGTLFGPFEEQPTEADAAPEDAPIAGVEELTLTGAGEYQSSGSVVAPESGFYVWVWSIDKDAQGENGKYLTGSFTDRFGQVQETSVVPFQPVAVSAVDEQFAVPGDAATDTITVSSSNGAWLKEGGEYLPVLWEGTAYQVAGAMPPMQVESVPGDAVAIGTVTITANGPGTYTSPEVVLPDAGFVTWVWQVRKESQPVEVRDYIAADWSDSFGVPEESTSVRHTAAVTSEVREYNVHKGGRAFDTILVEGMPEDHGDFAGDGYWAADVDEIAHTVYGPIASDTELTDEADLSTLPVLTSITTPARNGEYEIGFEDDERIAPTEPGFYVVVSSFVGDDRVLPFTSSLSDVRERFFVPAGEVPVTVVTQATPAAEVGAPFEDTALVQGTDIPNGATLVFRAFGPQAPSEEPVCMSPFFESDPIPVSGAGVYRSGPTTVDTAGTVYWVETLYGATGEVLVEGECGTPGEITVISGTPATPETPDSPAGQHPSSLAYTGGSVDWMIPAGAAALLLLVAGGVLLLKRRRLSSRAGGRVYQEVLAS